MLSAGQHRLAGDGVLCGQRLRHHRGAQETAARGRDRGHLRRRAQRSELPARLRTHPSRRQGRQHTADRERDSQTRRFRQCVDQVSGQFVRRHPILDGTGSHSGDGRGSVRRQSGRLVVGHNVHRTGGTQTALFQSERDVRSLSHRPERIADAVANERVERRVQTLRGGVPPKVAVQSAGLDETAQTHVRHAEQVGERARRSDTTHQGGRTRSRQPELQENEEDPDGGELRDGEHDRHGRAGGRAHRRRQFEEQFRHVGAQRAFDGRVGQQPVQQHQQSARRHGRRHGETQQGDESRGRRDRRPRHQQFRHHPHHQHRHQTTKGTHAGGDARADVRLQEDAARTSERPLQAGGEVQDGNGKSQEPTRQGVRKLADELQQRTGTATDQAPAGARQEEEAEQRRRKETDQGHHAETRTGP